MRLACWNSVWLEADFDPVLGSVRRRFSRKSNSSRAAKAGYYSSERPLLSAPVVFALYEQAGKLFFQAGRRRWHLSQSGLSFSFSHHRSGLSSKFLVREFGKPPFEITYFHLVRALSSFTDPAYDETEHENDHFLSVVATYGLSANWQSHMQQKWSSAGSVV